MSEGWTWRDEFERVVESYAHDFVKKNKPTNINDLLDLFNKVVPPASQSSFQDLVDDPTAATPPPQKETPVAKSAMSIPLYTCPACSDDVYGNATFAADDDATPSLDERGYFTVKMKMTGVRAESHDCRPRVTR